VKKTPGLFRQFFTFLGLSWFPEFSMTSSPPVKLFQGPLGNQLR